VVLHQLKPGQTIFGQRAGWPRAVRRRSSGRGNLKAGVTIEQAGADANRLSGAVVVSLSDYVIGPAKL
jgi:hypothetical protein